MVLGFAIVALGMLMLVAGFKGVPLAQVIRREAGTGTFLDDVSLPDIELGEAAPAPASTGATTPASLTGSASASGGAKAIVEQGAKIGAGFGLKVISAYRQGDPKDHGGNDANKAARDLSNARNGLSGPPTPEMDAAVEAIAAAFGTRVNGKGVVIKTWHWQGFRLQLIYRTPLYGDHRGHIHFGARKL